MQKTIGLTFETLCRSSPDSVRILQNFQSVLNENAVQKNCWTSERIMAMEKDENVSVEQHVLEHPAVYIDAPSLECECDSSDGSSISSRDSAGESTCRVGDKTRWILSVRNLVPGFLYHLFFAWSLGGERLGAINSVFSTSTGSYIVRKTLTQSSKQDSNNSSFVAYSSKLLTHVEVRDMHPRLTDEEALIGVRYADSASLQVRCKYL